MHPRTFSMHAQTERGSIPVCFLFLLHSAHCRISFALQQPHEPALPLFSPLLGPSCCCASGGGRRLTRFADDKPSFASSFPSAPACSAAVVLCTRRPSLSANKGACASRLVARMCARSHLGERTKRMNRPRAVASASSTGAARVPPWARKAQPTAKATGSRLLCHRTVSFHRFLGGAVGRRRSRGGGREADGASPACAPLPLRGWVQTPVLFRCRPRAHGSAAQHSPREQREKGRH
jgi:hypothetical protein